MSCSFAPQIIPKWAINHLGKKVRFLRQYSDGYRVWYPDQTATLDGLQVGAKGVECVIYFDDYDDHCYIIESVELFAPVYEGYDDDDGYPSTQEALRHGAHSAARIYFSDPQMRR